MLSREVSRKRRNLTLISNFDQSALLTALNEAADDGEEGQGPLHHRHEPGVPQKRRAEHAGEGQGGGPAATVHRLRQRVQGEQDPVSVPGTCQATNAMHCSTKRHNPVLILGTYVYIGSGVLCCSLSL